ncbi:hypothetical protein TM102_63680 [Bradyrhizobium sp. TM102]|nr:hypothetical protein TM102_63680 [Bradyrhizobium sp. TM102]
MAAAINRFNGAGEALGAPRWADPNLSRDAVPHGFRATFKDWCTEQAGSPNHLRHGLAPHDSRQGRAGLPPRQHAGEGRGRWRMVRLLRKPPAPPEWECMPLRANAPRPLEV